MITIQNQKFTSKKQIEKILNSKTAYNQHITFKGCIFKDCKIQNLQADFITFDDCTIIGGIYKQIYGDNIIIKNCTFTECNIQDIEFYYCYLYNNLFDNCFIKNFYDALTTLQKNQKVDCIIK